MKNHHTLFSLDQMAKTFGVSRSGYYDYLKGKPSIRSLENEKLVDRMRVIFDHSHQTYGSPRLHAALKEEDFKDSRPRIARLMKAHDIQAKMYKRFKKTTKRSDKYVNYPDLIQQNFYPSHPNCVWVSDITYICVNKKWSYLAVVLDLFSCKVVGMALQEHMKSDLVLQATTQALLHRRPPKGLIHHSDLGSQYTSHDLHKLATQQGINLSYGKSAYDNAVMESFFHTLKTERTYFKTYQTLEQARLDIFAYIFTFYNSKRRHSTLKYQTPNQAEDKYYKEKFISLLSV